MKGRLTYRCKTNEIWNFVLMIQSICMNSLSINSASGYDNLNIIEGMDCANIYSLKC